MDVTTTALFSPFQNVYCNFLAQATLGSMAKPDIWYVSFGADKALKRTDGTSPPSRTTRSFKTEADARTFAIEIIRKGWAASAGTINPYQPKQMIGPSDIEAWATGSLQAESR